MTDEPIVVELMGTPGAGKSTVARALQVALSELGVAVLCSPESTPEVAARSGLGALAARLASGRPGEILNWRIFAFERWLRGISVLLARPGLVRILLSSQILRPAAAQAAPRRPTHWLVRMAGERAMLLSRRKTGEVVVIDEGFCHRVVQLFTSSVETADPRTVARYVAVVPAPSLVIRVMAPVGVCLARIRDRGVWDRFDGDEEGLESFLNSAADALVMVADQLENRGVRLVTVDNSGPDDPDRLPQRLLGALKTAGVVT